MLTASTTVTPRVPDRATQASEVRWEAAFSALTHFAASQGHTFVPRNGSEFAIDLGTWVAVQRLRCRRGQLAPDRVARLESVPGWTWDPLQDRWDAGLCALSRFVERESQMRIPVDHVEDGVNISVWAASQRRLYRAGKLSAERIERLQAVPGWTWVPTEDFWEKAYPALSKFAAREGHVRIPAGHVEDGVALGPWIRGQRIAYRRGALTSTHASQLEQLPGWCWEPHATRWDSCFNALREFVEREGHARVPALHIENDSDLGSWVSWQRIRYRRNTLPSDHAMKLQGLAGWSWDVATDHWEERYTALLAYARREGHSCVPRRHVEGDVRLGTWVGRQREAHQRGRLTSEQADRLQALPGWSWRASPRRSRPRHLQRLDAQWNAAARAASRFASREGHFDVPFEYREDGFFLRKWITKQRRLYRRGELTLERIEYLQSLPGWCWNAAAD